MKTAAPSCTVTASDQSGQLRLAGGQPCLCVHAPADRCWTRQGKTVYEQAVKFQSPALVRRRLTVPPPMTWAARRSTSCLPRGWSAHVDMRRRDAQCRRLEHQDGWLTVASSESGCKAAVRVYDASGAAGVRLPLGGPLYDDGRRCPPTAAPWRPSTMGQEQRHRLPAM
ncbi:MAG: hypothetical protein ACLUNQ_01760 [Oscillospiraceae bacterium]